MQSNNNSKSKKRPMASPSSPSADSTSSTKKPPYVYRGSRFIKTAAQPSNSSRKPITKDVTQVIIDWKITSQGIPEREFYKHPNLTKVEIPTTVSNISNNAFGECLNLKEVTFLIAIQKQKQIQRELLEDGDGATDDGTAGSRGTLRSNGSSKAGYANMIHDESSSILEQPYLIQLIGKEAFVKCSNLQSITIPPSIHTLGISCFHDCLKLQHVNLQQGKLRVIGKSCFHNCKSLESIELPTNKRPDYQQSQVFCVCEPVQPTHIKRLQQLIDDAEITLILKH